MKKLLAFVLAFTIAFSVMGYAPGYAAWGVSPEASTLADIGMLEGDGHGVTWEYTQKQMNRFTAAISILKLRGLYEEALNYSGTANFADKNEVLWADGRAILAYLKANPDLGFIGDERGRFGPYNNINEQAYYKVLLETLGYKQAVTGVKGDFTWDGTLKFAESIGLKPSKEAKFTIDLLSKATVSALKAKTKDGKVYINVLVDTGKIRKSTAIAAGLMKDIIDVEAKSAKAVGNTVIEVVFTKKIDRYDGENLDNYSVQGLSIKSADLAGADTVRLTTSSMSSGKLYTLNVGNTKLKFTGVAKASGSPRIKNVKSEDVETVVIEFDKELDFASATNASNYSISGIDVVKAELEGKKVTLSTYGLVGRKQYTVKATNIKSIDGVALRSDSRSFYTRLDTTAPSLRDVKAETNQRVVIKFSEAVTRASAEDVGNYLIKTVGTELGILEAQLVGDDEDTVELITEPQKAGARYELTVENISDKTKAANVMKKAAKKTFYGMRVDTSAPQLSKGDLKALSRNYIQVVFSDSSRFNEATVLDANNYEITRNDRYKESIYVESVEKVSHADGKYKVMLRVEDLDVNSSYTVTIFNIEDEFGNVMEKNNSGTLRVSRDDFAAATVKNYKVVGGNKIEIYFTKPLDEKSAEDIANYEINNDIGSPIGAKYEDEKVTLETASMTEGKIYKININGVVDATGNRLKLSFEFRAIAGENDLRGPELQYVYTVNKYVVAAVFDEPVSYTTGGSDATAMVLKAGNKTIKLYAKATTDDGRTIEFSNVEEGKTLSGYGVYTIVKEDSLKGIRDKSVNRNAFDRSYSWDYGMDIYGNDEEPEVPEILYITQRDGKTFELEMSKKVVVKNSKASTIGTPSATFDVKVEREDDKLVTFTISSTKYIDNNKDYKVDLSKILTDKHGIKAKNTDSGYTMLYGEYKDEDKPYILTVTAIDRLTVEIEYNEAIGYEGRYTIKNADDYSKYKTITNSLKKIDKNKVILTLGQPLEGRYEYILIIDSQAKDLVGNISENIRGEEFYFTGTDLAPVKVPEMDDQIAADAVINKIAALPTDIKLTDKEAVEDAAAKYNALTSKQKQLVTNYSKLSESQTEISRLAEEQRKAEEAKRLEEEQKRIKEDRAKAAAVEKKINDLPVTEMLKLGNKKAVEEAREAYKALTAGQQVYVTNYTKLENAEKRIAALEEEQKKTEEEQGRIKADKEKAAVVEKKINDLPAIEILKLENKKAAEEARGVYNALTAEQKAYVTNYEKLLRAEAKIAVLEEEAKHLKEEENRIKEDKAKAAAVDEKINALPVLEMLRLENKDAVKEAREAYKALTAEQKAYVTNYQKLVNAEARIAELEEEAKRLEEEQNRIKEDKAKAAAVEEKINALPGSLVLENKKAVEEAREAYKTLTAEQQAYVTNYPKLVDAEARILELEEEAKRLEEERIKKEEEERRLEEERRKAEEEANKAAESAVNKLEAEAGEEGIGVQSAALVIRVQELKNSLSIYLGPPIAPEKRSIVDMAMNAAKRASDQVEAKIQSARALEAPAREVVGNLEEGSLKSALNGRISAAIAKIEKAAETSELLNGEISTVKDALDVEDAKAALIVGSFKFDLLHPALSVEPRILALKPHANGAVYKYAEVGNMVDGKYVKYNIIKEGKSPLLEIVKETGDIIVTRDIADADMILKVEAAKGSSVGMKLFKVNIPTDPAKPVTIEAVQEAPVK